MDTTSGDVAAFIRDALSDPACTWSIGGFGALATFGRTSAEPVSWLDDGRIGLSTADGAIALHVGLYPVAYETAFGSAWSHAVAFCLPAAVLGAQARTIAERGPDSGAILQPDRDAILFDGGFGLRQAAIGLRSADRRIVGRWRAACGTAERPDDLRELLTGAHRVVTAGHSRIEIFDRPAADPPGPRLLVDQKLLGLRRTHAATAPIPEGLVPVAHVYPPHPMGSEDGAFLPDRHAAFQAILRRWGRPDLVALKASLIRGGNLPAGADRHARMVAKVIVAQIRAGQGLAESAW